MRGDVTSRNVTSTEDAHCIPQNCRIKVRASSSCRYCIIQIGRWDTWCVLTWRTTLCRILLSVFSMALLLSFSIHKPIKHKVSSHVRTPALVRRCAPRTPPSPDPDPCNQAVTCRVLTVPLAQWALRLRRTDTSGPSRMILCCLLDLPGIGKTTRDSPTTSRRHASSSLSSAASSPAPSSAKFASQPTPSHTYRGPCAAITPLSPSAIRAPSWSKWKGCLRACARKYCQHPVPSSHTNMLTIRGRIFRGGIFIDTRRG